jgi:hypothetical protein
MGKLDKWKDKFDEYLSESSKEDLIKDIKKAGIRLTKWDEDRTAPKTYVAIVLDKSGSMGSVRRETISGFNEQVQSIKKNAKGQVYTSLVTFNDNVEEVYFNQSIDKLEEISEVNYQPYGCTAMYDAVHHTIKRLEDEADDKDDTAFLLIIMSDGCENASTKVSQNDLAELIQSVQKTNKWTITYMGANQDLSKIQENLHLKAGNMRSYVASSAGTKDAFATMGDSTMRYMNVRGAGATVMDAFYEEPPTDSRKKEDTK